ncbi:LysR family transcriptional regulator [Mycolicibacterium canariasense]|uniref:Probable hydrogen peroxide-inducible genes activator n=1 Tax=Mycolicibacterium canariasense TaxID=228230 RepID=A0A100WH93_MYCCR|nr:LysR family transcriptional regulator [Mycolicibacterium canariasense]MCV7213015.1 LysR family transcriptional regulator [Mycolicibacterium canariasense]ORV10193.1 LysR family transcriptional regulator [Mycolicibacterium canariasense]GAS98156.1 LysR family transcriptional regulator [Mycolicibacterium canariasense]
MELRQLEYFVAVVEEANFTRAAQRMLVAQPAVSTQVARLERELGQPLLDRSRREVRLTAAGQAVLPFARAALRAVRQARTAVDELAQLVRGVVTIGTVTSHNVDMPQLLADYHHAHPGVEIMLSTDTSDALIDGVRAGRLDVAIASVGADEVPDGLAVLPTTEQVIDAVVGVDDPWARRRTVGLAALADRPLISLPVGGGIRRQFDIACAEAGVSPRVAFEAATPEALADLAARGLGVAIVPRSVSRARRDVHAIAIVPELRGRLVLAWRADGPVSPAARALVDMARELLGVGGGE